MSGKTVKKLIGVLFIIVGIIIFIIGNQCRKDDILFRKNAIKTNAVIEKINRYPTSDDDYRYDVIVSFEVNNKKYSGSLNSWNSSMYEGKEVTIYYDKNDPNKFKSDLSNLLLFVAFGMGIVFFLVGFILLLVEIINKIKYNYLLKNGIRIEAKIEDIYINEHIYIAGKHPYILVCTSVDKKNNKIYSFKSENIWFDIKSLVQSFNITFVPVIVLKDNYKKYVVDLEELKKYMGN